MTAVRPGLADPLIALLGARWALGARPMGCAWFSPQAAAFGLADGTLAIAPSVWPGGARVQQRLGGGVELVPATAAAPPLVRIGVHEGPCAALAADYAGGVLSGGHDGRLAAVAADGRATHLAQFDAPIAGIATAPGGACACATGALARRLDGEAAVLEAPGTITALAFDPAGKVLAIGHEGGVTLWSADAVRPLKLDAAPRALAWSPDGAFLISGHEGGARGWRVADGAALELTGAPLCLSFSTPLAPSGAFLAASGAARVICWRLDAQAAPVREECGAASMQPVARVACHPTRKLIAAGYANGAVLLGQPGAGDILFVREAGGGAVTQLAWSPDGAFLALAVEAGEVGVVAFPDLLFRAAQPGGASA